MILSYQTIIDKYYPAAGRLRDIYIGHCRSVANEALMIAEQKQLPIDKVMIEGAAMTHDIGIYATNAPSIACEGEYPYICHGIIGAELLRKEGAPEEWARVAERHTGSGLTCEEIVRQRLPLPHADYLPETLLEKLICYADKFYSKGGSSDRKRIEDVRAGMARFGADSLARFDALHDLFGSD